MKKEKTCKILALIFLSVFSISLIAGVVSAAIFDPVKDMFTDWAKGQLSLNVAKYIFIVLFGLFIFAVLRLVPFLGDNMTVRIISSSLIAFLAGAYLTPKEVYIVVSSYSALGAVIGVLIPFMIMVAITTELPTKENFYKNKIFGYVLWGLFSVFAIWKAISGLWLYTEGASAEMAKTGTVLASGISGLTIAILVIVSISSVAMFIFFGTIFNKLSKVATESRVEEMESGMRRQFGALRKVLKESVETGLEAAAGG